MAWAYDPFMKSLEKVLIRYRTQLLQQASGTVLEVGAGTGVNFDLYPKNVKVIAIEPSIPMYKKAVKRAASFPNITVYNMGIEQVKSHKELPDTFDTIVSMLVLCTVQNDKQVAGMYTDLLKDKGALLVLEHIHSTGTFYGKVQTLVNPVWKPIADGCNLTRRQDFVLKDAGFLPENEKYFHIGTDWYYAIMKKQ